MPAKLAADNSTRSSRHQQSRPQQQQQKRVASSTESGSSSSVSKSDGSGVKGRRRETSKDTFQQGTSRFPALLRASSLFMSHGSKTENGAVAANVAASTPDAEVDATPSSPFTAVTSTTRAGRSKEANRSTSASSSAQSASRARKSNADGKKEQPQPSPSSGRKSAGDAEEIKTKAPVSVRSIGIQVSPPSPDVESSTSRPAMQATSSRQSDEERNGRTNRAKPIDAQHYDSRDTSYEGGQSNRRSHSSMIPPPPYDDSLRQPRGAHSQSTANGDRLASTAMAARSSSSSSSEASHHHLQGPQHLSSVSSSSSPSRVSRKTRATINRQISRAGIPGLAGSSSAHESADVPPAEIEPEPLYLSRDDASNPHPPSTSIATSTSVPTSSVVESTDPSVSGRSASMSVSTNASSTASSSRHTLEGYIYEAGRADVQKPYCFHTGFQSSSHAAQSRHTSEQRHSQHSAQQYLPTPPDSERKLRLDDHSNAASPQHQPRPSPALLETYGTDAQHMLLQPLPEFASLNLRIPSHTLAAGHVIDPSSQAALLHAYQQQQGQQQQIAYMHGAHGFAVHQPHVQQSQQHLQPQPSQTQQYPPAASQTRSTIPIQQNNLAPPSPSEFPLVFPSLHSPSLLPTSEPTSSRSVSPQPSSQHTASSAGHSTSMSPHQQQQQRAEAQADLLGSLQVVQAQLEYNQQAQAHMQAHYLANTQLTPQQVYINQLQQQQQQLQQAYMGQQVQPSTPMHQSYNQPLVSPMLSPYGVHMASPIAYSPSIASPQMHSPYAGSAGTWSEATAVHSHAAMSGNTSLGSISTSGGTLRRKPANLASSDVASSSMPPPSPLSSSASASGQRKKGARRPGARTRVASLNENEQYLLSPNQLYRENGQFDSPTVSRGRRVPPASPSLAGKRRNSTNQTISSRMSQADADEAELADESVISNDQELLNSLQDISFDDLDPDKVKSTLQGMELVLERRAKELEIAKWKLKCVEVDRRDTQLEHHRALVHFAERAERAEARIRLLETANTSGSAASAPLGAPDFNGSTVLPPQHGDRDDENQREEHDPFQPHTSSPTAYKTDLPTHNLTYSMTTPSITAYEFSQEPSLDYPPYPFPSKNVKNKPRRRKRTSEGPSPAISLDFMRRDSLAPMPPSARSVTSKSSSESLSFEQEGQNQSDLEGSDDDDVEIVLDASFSRTSSRSGTISSQAMLATPSGDKSGAFGLGMSMENHGLVASADEVDVDGDTNTQQPSYVGSLPSFSFSLLPNSPSKLDEHAAQDADGAQPSSPTPLTS